MEITKKFRDQILIAMPELSQADAKKIADTEQCSTVTVYSHWKKLKDLEGNLSSIMLSIGELASSKKKSQKETHKRADKIMQQLSAA